MELKRVTEHPLLFSAGSKGFTLVELLAAVLIIGLLTGAVLPIFSSYARRQNLSHAAKQLKTDIQAIKSQAISGVVSCVGCAGENWGIHLLLGQSTYVIFSTTGFAYNSNTSAKTKDLSSGVTISRIWVSGTTRNPVNILFERLNGAVSAHWDGGASIPGEPDIRIELNLSGTTRYVRVDSGGKVYEE
jgi:prepilin-type N-terminal cleavage/methylation domain-containing protein